MGTVTSSLIGFLSRKEKIYQYDSFNRITGTIAEIPGGITVLVSSDKCIDSVGDNKDKKIDVTSDTKSNEEQKDEKNEAMNDYGISDKDDFGTVAEKMYNCGRNDRKASLNIKKGYTITRTGDYVYFKVPYAHVCENLNEDNAASNPSKSNAPTSESKINAPALESKINAPISESKSGAPASDSKGEAENRSMNNIHDKKIQEDVIIRISVKDDDVCYITTGDDGIDSGSVLAVIRIKLKAESGSKFWVDDFGYCYDPKPYPSYKKSGCFIHDLSKYFNGDSNDDVKDTKGENVKDDKEKDVGGENLNKKLLFCGINAVE